MVACQITKAVRVVVAVTRALGEWESRQGRAAVSIEPKWFTTGAIISSNETESKTSRHRLGARSVDALETSSTVGIEVAITLAVPKRKRTSWKVVVSNVCQNADSVGIVAVVFSRYTRTSASWDSFSIITLVACQITKAVRVVVAVTRALGEWEGKQGRAVVCIEQKCKGVVCN